MDRTVDVMAKLVSVWIIGYLLVAGRGLLVPFVIAIFIWHLLNTIERFVNRLPLPFIRHYSILSRILALLVVVTLIKVTVDIITNNVSEVIAASSRYQENLMAIFNRLDNAWHIRAFLQLDNLLQNLNIQKVLVNIYGMFTSLTSSAVLITLYVIFLFVEQHYFRQKLSALFPKKTYREVADNIISHIMQDTQTYLGIKTLLSILTAISGFVIMKCVGLDFAEFWGLLIFFLNFIPNIGAIVATAFPAILALLQFNQWGPFLVLTSLMIAVQFFVGNVLEPRFLGKSLNLSSLVILLSLAFWGSIWGVLGMFLSVPITVMLMIIFAHFENTRALAILLSQDGQIQKAYSKLPISSHKIE